MGEMVGYGGAAGSGEGYLAVPDSGTASPAVIVTDGWWGLTPHLTSVADRFAAAGFVAFAPDLRLAAAIGSDGVGPDDASSDETGPGETGRLVTGPALDRAARETARVADYLTGRPEVTARVGCVGFCAGGSLALWSATHSAHIVATVGFYPVLPTDRPHPDWADYAGKAALIHRSGADGASADEGVQAARRAIEAAGGECVLHDYPGTSREFFNDDRPEVFDQPAAASAWARTLDFFRTRLG